MEGRKQGSKGRKKSKIRIILLFKTMREYPSPRG